MAGDVFEYHWTLDPFDVRNAIVMFKNGNAIDRFASVKGISVSDLRRDIAMPRAADVIRVATRISGRKPDIRRRPFFVNFGVA